MRSEKEKMLAGELYDATDEELTRERTAVRLLLKAFNDLPEDRTEERAGLQHRQRKSRLLQGGFRRFGPVA